MVKNQKHNYPTENPDWLLVGHYRKIKSRFGCVLCEKTHRAKDCPNRAKEEEKVVEEKKTSYYTDYNTMYAGYDDDSYGY